MFFLKIFLPFFPLGSSYIFYFSSFSIVTLNWLFSSLTAFSSCLIDSIYFKICWWEFITAKMFGYKISSLLHKTSCGMETWQWALDWNSLGFDDRKKYGLSMQYLKLLYFPKIYLIFQFTNFGANHLKLIKNLFSIDLISLWRYFSLVCFFHQEKITLDLIANKITKPFNSVVLRNWDHF